MTDRPFLSFFFFNDPPPTEIYTLSLHDALPIWATSRTTTWMKRRSGAWWRRRAERRPRSPSGSARARSEEHTSELQSRRDLVCRLLLEKKKTFFGDRQITTDVLGPRLYHSLDAR